MMCWQMHIRLFQSTLPQGERPDDRKLLSLPLYFNPRSRKGSDQSCIQTGLTYAQFQSTLPQGERRHGRSWMRRRNHFNPRSRKGSDDKSGSVPEKAGISIHAPARGATLSPCTDFAGQRRFQSTLPQGERHLSLYTRGMYTAFQSTLPQGERQRDKILTPTDNDFNPRSRKGSDDADVVGLPGIHIISIHAPARGATIL